MDIIFKCPHCGQELEVDSGGVGSTLECPACSNSLTVPTPDSEDAAFVSTPPAAPAPPPPVEAKHFTVPTHDHEPAAEVLILKPKRPLDIIAKEGDKKIRIKTFKRSDCQEVGRDRFDEKVSHFLEEVGQLNIVSINTINYSTIDMTTHTQVQDYGVLIVFKG